MSDYILCKKSDLEDIFRTILVNKNQSIKAQCITVKEASASLKMSVKSLKNKVASGHIPLVEIPDRKPICYTIKSWNEYLERINQ